MKKMYRIRKLADSLNNSDFPLLFLYFKLNTKGTVRSGTMLVCNGNDRPEFKGQFHD